MEQKQVKEGVTSEQAWRDIFPDCTIIRGKDENGRQVLYVSRPLPKKKHPQDVPPLPVTLRVVI